VALAFGPMLDPENTWGRSLLDLEDEQAARAIGASDPAVESGTCTYEGVSMQLVRRAERRGRAHALRARHFCWVGLATSDPGAAKAFYTSLFGWKADGR
jgi:hypothetical protein